MWGLVGVEVLLWRRRAENQEWTAFSGDPLGHTGRESLPSWSAFERNGTGSVGTKDLASAIELPHSLAYKQRPLLRATNQNINFLLHITINSKPLHIHVTSLLDRPATVQ